MIYRVKLRNKRTNKSAWINIVAYTKKDAMRKTVATLINTNIYYKFEIRKVKKAIFYD